MGILALNQGNMFKAAEIVSRSIACIASRWQALHPLAADERHHILEEVSITCVYMCVFS